MKLDKLIQQLNAMRSIHGGDTNVSVVTPNGFFTKIDENGIIYNDKYGLYLRLRRNTR
jgi:hypothetical protein